MKTEEQVRRKIAEFADERARLTQAITGTSLSEDYVRLRRVGDIQLEVGALEWVLGEREVIP